ncbi:MAG: hypothetical protein AAGI38_18400 [Bacteroidota bacterium]
MPFSSGVIRTGLWIGLILTSLSSVSGQGLLRYESLTGHVEAGVSFLDLDKVNEVMDGDGFLQFPSTYFAFGGGITRLNNKLIYGGSAYGYMTAQPGFVQNLPRLATLHFHYANLKIGYLAYLEATNPEQPIMVYPTLGVGGGLARLRTSPDSLANYTPYTTFGINVDAAIHVDFYVPLQRVREESRPAVMKLGLQVGYLFSASSGWVIDDYPSDPDIPLAPGGLYIRAVLGMGNLKQK